LRTVPAGHDTQASGHAGAPEPGDLAAENPVRRQANASKYSAFRAASGCLRTRWRSTLSDGRACGDGQSSSGHAGRPDHGALPSRVRWAAALDFRLGRFRDKTCTVRHRPCVGRPSALLVKQLSCSRVLKLSGCREPRTRSPPGRGLGQVPSPVGLRLRVHLSSGARRGVPDIRQVRLR